MKYRANRTQYQACLSIDEMPPILCKKEMCGTEKNAISLFHRQIFLLTAKK